MFAGSTIAKNFRCSETKARYLIAFGVGPYLQAQLHSRVKEAGEYVLLFDETLNNVLQAKQMDLCVRI